MLGGFGVAWAGWAGQLGILGSYGAGMETETAAGVGMPSAALGVRWAVGKWERAKRRWWKDWDRVGEGLERDLRVCRFAMFSVSMILIYLISFIYFALPDDVGSCGCRTGRRSSREGMWWFV